MMNYKKIELDTWKRKEHFEFFSAFDEPFLGIVSEIDCTRAMEKAKARNASLFSWYLHKSLVAVNDVEELRCRVMGGDPVIYENVHASATIGREDGTFGFSFVPYDRDFSVFDTSLKNEIDAVKKSEGLRLTKESKRINVIHYSSLPWYKITGLSHARNFKYEESQPKITFGKIYESEDKKMMAVSINAHHGLVDGLHISKFLEIFQNLMNE
jgi:chloramphenicol O-acetyltransferase type A